MPVLSDFPDRLLATEVAPLLRTSDRTVQRMARDGEFPGAVLVGHRWLIPKADIEALLCGDAR